MRLCWHAYRTASAAQNMAQDWALLVGTEAAEKKYGAGCLPVPILPEPDTAHFRAYGWSEDAMSIGYTQQQRAITEHLREGATIVRRPTAGGIVDHAEDWTYALSLPRSAPLAQERSSVVYAQLHGTLLDTFAEFAVQVERFPCPCADAPVEPVQQTGGTAARCFQSPVPYDLMTPNGEKLAGAALRRTREGLLVQGSISRAHLPADFPYKVFERALAPAFARLLKAALVPSEASAC